jgi:hypothetical protein
VTTAANYSILVAATPDEVRAAATVPVALRYRLADGSPTTVAAFVGDDTMFASVWRVVSARDLVADVDIRPLVGSAGRTRREVATTVAAELVAGQAPVTTDLTTPLPHQRPARVSS